MMMEEPTAAEAAKPPHTDDPPTEPPAVEAPKKARKAPAAAAKKTKTTTTPKKSDAGASLVEACGVCDTCIDLDTVKRQPAEKLQPMFIVELGTTLRDMRKAERSHKISNLKIT